MPELAVFIPISAIIATAWVIVVALNRRRPKDGSPADARENIRLSRENGELRETIGRLEKRMQVLERIATDPAERTAREIEELR